ncbi:MAG: cytochrome c oxidase subunit II [Bacteriovoracaceae bacterium]
MKGLYPGTTIAANHLDTFTLILTLTCSLVTVGIVITTIYFCYKFHASKKLQHPENFQSTKIEVLWTSITLIIFMSFFTWATYLYKVQITPPKKVDYEILVYGKRWMWKFYHQNGFAEVNHLHLPKNKNIRLTMISKDVIHSFFLPDFRLKQDLLPETYTYLHLRPAKNGKYRIYCAEYCGSYHAKMTGITTVMNETDYLAHTGMLQKQTTSRGHDLFIKSGCISCHNNESQTAPFLPHYTAKRTDAFLRRSILYPKEYVEKGFEPVMPSFKEILSEKDIKDIIDYLRATEVK